jgi:hypothetical protein
VQGASTTVRAGHMTMRRTVAVGVRMCTALEGPQQNGAHGEICPRRRISAD